MQVDTYKTESALQIFVDIEMSQTTNMFYKGNVLNLSSLASVQIISNAFVLINYIPDPPKKF